MRMKCLTIFSILLLFFFTALAQKPPLDYAGVANWPKIRYTKLSNDGRFVCYSVYSQGAGALLSVEPADLSWKRKISTESEPFFTEDSRRLVFMAPDEKLGILDLLTNSIQYISGVRSLEVPEKVEGEWIIFRRNDTTQSLTLRDLASGVERSYSGVLSYTFSQSGRVFLMNQLLDRTRVLQEMTLRWVSLEDLQEKEVFHRSGQRCPGATDFAFDRSDEQLAFLTVASTGCARTLWYFKVGMAQAVALIDSATAGMSGRRLSERDVNSNKSASIFFNDSGDRLFFSVVSGDSRAKQFARDSLVKVDVWSYRDEFIQSRQLQDPFVIHREYLATINLLTKDSVMLLQVAADENKLLFSSDDAISSFAQLSGATGDPSEYAWRPGARPDLFLVSTKNGSRRLLEGKVMCDGLSYSPGGKYIVWYDRTKRCWYCYNVAKATKVLASKAIPTPLWMQNDRPELPWAAGIAGWLSDDSAVLIYDRFDIWKVDPEGLKPPMNLTSGYGSKHNIQLRYMNFRGGLTKLGWLPDTLILSAFGGHSKRNSVFSLSLRGKVVLRQICNSSGILYFLYPTYTPEMRGILDPFIPLKARDTGLYLVRRMDDDEFPNISLTRDFATFWQVTELSPQKSYNWYKSQLIGWQLENRKTGVGILYKPTDFDSRKKYPLIIYVYEKNSDALHTYIEPALSNGVLNIPWYVSHGYLVFVPDIEYKIGYPGESAYQTVITAAKYLSTLPWVDRRKMGLQGHSFGGYETDYIVTRTSLFAAAAPSAGTSNIISEYGQLMGGDVKHWFYENSQGRIGGSLWKHRQQYILNSPIFHADRVKTPLLIMHNQQDETVSWTQGVEWFTGLRRLGKKVWMLQYDGEGHTIDNERNQLDYSIRLSQFFDHYLKGLPAPEWMTEGISAEKKGTTSGFEFDPHP